MNSPLTARVWWGWSIAALLSCGDSTDTAVSTEEADTTEESNTDTPQSFEVTGVVLDDDGSPIEGANVLIGGQPDTLVLTDADGKFSLWYSNINKGTPAVVASKLGFRTKGYEFFKPDTPVTFTLREVKAPDNPDYTFQNPGTGDDQREENCSHCHTDFVKDFWTSKHSESASNPLLHDLYAGVTRLANNQSDCEEFGGTWKVGVEPGTENNSVEKCYVDHGVLSDLNPTCSSDTQACDNPNKDDSHLPTEFGGCADCHAPGINGELMGRNLHDAVGLAYDAGIHCDTCHKVKDVDMSQPAGFGSRLVVHRPGEPGRNTFEWDPVYYGPIKDVPNVAMAASPQEKFNEAVFCAGCHEHNQDALLPDTTLDLDKWPNGLPIQSTYSEWQDGPYNNPDTPCQWCHMPSYVDKTNAVDIATVENQSITFGFPRPPEDVRQHIFRSPLAGSPRLIDTAVHLSLQTEYNAGVLNVHTSIANVGCGHAIPTGEPLRAMYVVLTLDESCQSATVLDGPIIDEVGGHLSMGTVGDDIGLSQTSDSTVLQWDNLDTSGLNLEQDLSIRVLKQTENFDDYVGIGRFSETTLAVADKGLPRWQLVDVAEILNIQDDTITLNKIINGDPGDHIVIVQTANLQDDTASSTLTGLAGQSFAKILVDADGQMQIPHYRATDIIRDNRIPPGSNVLLEHSFDLPEGCTSGSVTATMVYRPLPMSIAKTYDWDSRDYTIATSEVEWQ